MKILIQVRAQDIRPETLGHVVTQVIEQFREELVQGALISIDPQRARVRILPFGG